VAARDEKRGGAYAGLVQGHGYSLESIIAAINPILRGWYNYFRHGNIYTLKTLDSWVRGRLRSILRKRIKRKGKAKGGLDHRRWPNRFFDEAGLFNLTVVSAFLCAGRFSFS
jgi:RNA-directed DNA polymerase